MAAELIGGRYRLGTLLGQSGMSEVWCADDLELGRRVALKLLAPDADRERFAREARAVAALAHPNISQLYDYGEADGRPFMVLEYLPGGTLEELLEPGLPLDDAATARVSGEVAAGLAHAHARGLVHRDLKPANVLFDAEGRAKIADFGIARLGHGGTLTEAGTVLGTAAYISPEQASGETATPASDVYSFGVMLYRLLTGRLPFVSDDAFALVSLHRDAPPPPLEELRGDAPPVLAATATAALAKDPTRRPHDGAALVAALAGAGAPVPAAESGASAVAAPTDADATAVLAPPPGANAPPRRRRALPLVLAGVFAVLAAGGAALAFAVSRSGDGPSPPPTVLRVDKPKAPAKDRRATTASVTAAVVPAVTPTESTTSTTTTTSATTATTTRRTRTATSPVVTIAPPPTVPPVTTTPPPPTDTTTLPTTGTTTGP